MRAIAIKLIIKKGRDSRKMVIVSIRNGVFPSVEGATKAERFPSGQEVNLRTDDVDGCAHSGIRLFHVWQYFDYC